MAAIPMPFFEDEVEPPEVGFCRGRCKHLDCEAAKAQRAALCPFCGKGFQGGDMFFFDSENRPCHANCIAMAGEVKEDDV